MMGWQLIYRVVLMLLVGACSVGTYLFYEHKLYFCMFFGVVMVVILIVHLNHTYTLAMRRLKRMVESIRYGDFSLCFSQGKYYSHEEYALLEDINEVMSGLRIRLSEKEERYKYFETLLDTVDTCMLVTDKQGNVLWMNRAGVQELCGHTIHQLVELKTLNPDFPAIMEELHPGVVKLVRVLTHEIMNSITPIISLSDTLCERAIQQGMEEESLMLQGMKTIHRRSRGLLTFVENYRKLSRLSSPILTPVSVGDLLRDIKKLFSQSSVRYKYKVEDEARMLLVDRSQMEQVLINLLKNAGEACAEVEHPEVMVETFFDEAKHIFRLPVHDNGCGILPEVLDKIFIPFFTTKPTGSGIGLSLCKQIMTLHGGSLQVTSEVGKGSCFVMKLWVKR